MKHNLALCLAALARALLALARWLDSDDPPPGGGPRSNGRRPQSIDLPRSHYRFVHVPPTRWQILQSGLAVLLASLRFGLAPAGTALAGPSFAGGGV